MPEYVIDRPIPLICARCGKKGIGDYHLTIHEIPDGVSTIIVVEAVHCLACSAIVQAEEAAIAAIGDDPL